MADMYRLTTLDNPYDPFEQFTSWFLWDTQNGYNTCGRLARLVDTSDELSDQENTQVIEKVMDDIIRYDPLNIYKKVSRTKSNSKSNSENEFNFDSKKKTNKDASSGQENNGSSRTHS